MARQWTGKWPGGRTRLGDDGGTVYVIEKMRDDQRYSISLDVDGPKAALAELALFERDPLLYSAASTPVAAPKAVVMSASLIADFVQAKMSSDHPISKEHAQGLLRYLKQWRAKLGNRDLRKLTVLEYNAVLEAMPSPKHAVIALRSFTKWLRQTGKLSSTEDASQDLSVPQAGYRRTRPGFRVPTMEEFERIYAAITSKPGHPFNPYQRRPAQAIRDVLAIRALTGLHDSEIASIAAGAWPVTPLEGFGPIAGVVKVFHKKGLPHPQALPKKALDAALRIQASGYIPNRKTVHAALDEAIKEAGIDLKLRPTVLRHAFITWAGTHGQLIKPQEAGIARSDIAQVVGHTSLATTMIYDGTEIPPLALLPLKLENVEDPV